MSPAGVSLAMGRQDRVRRSVGGHAERLGCLDKGCKDLLRDAFGFDLPVDDLDEDAPEDGAVEELAQAGIGLLVRLTWLTKQRQRVIESLHDVVDLGDGLGLPALDLGLLVRDAQLFGLEDFDRDGVAVVELDKLLLLECQFVKASAVALSFSFRRGGLGADELMHGLPKGCLLLLVQPRPIGMHLCNGFLNAFDCGVRIAAWPSRPDPAQAGVVLVVAAELASMVAVAEPSTADAAVERAAEVVAVLLGAFPAGPVGVEHSLDALEGVAVNDGLMPTRTLDPVAGHESGVVVVAQDAVDRRTSHRPGRPRSSRPGAQSGLVQEVGQRRQRHVSGGGEVKQQPDKRCPLGIERDRGDLSIPDLLTDVEIAQACGTVAATGLVLALQAEFDLFGVAAGAKGVDAGHDGVEQLAGRCVVDPLKGGFQLAAAPFDLSQEPQGVEVITGDA